VAKKPVEEYSRRISRIRGTPAVEVAMSQGLSAEDNRIASAPARAVVRAVAVMVVATVLAPVAASPVIAQTPPSPTGAPNALPRTFPAPALAKTAPAKTAPVKQAKSCSSYGEGFVNVPGTDTCIKAGAYVRTEVGGHR
jgi:hypothetical protein